MTEYVKLANVATELKKTQREKNITDFFDIFNRLTDEDLHCDDQAQHCFIALSCIVDASIVGTANHNAAIQGLIRVGEHAKSNKICLNALRKACEGCGPDTECHSVVMAAFERLGNRMITQICFHGGFRGAVEALVVLNRMEGRIKPESPTRPPLPGQGFDGYDC